MVGKLAIMADSAADSTPRFCQEVASFKHRGVSVEREGAIRLPQY